MTDISSGGSYSAPNVDWTGLSISQRQQRTLTFDATVAASGSYTNYAQITASDNFDPDSTPNDNSTTQDDDDTLTPTVVPVSDLSLTKAVALTMDADGNSVITVGDTATFNVTVTNSGPNAASSVQVTDQLATGFTYLSHSGTGTYDPAMGLWTIGNLANGASTSLQIVVLVNSNGGYSNVAEVTASSNFDPDSTPNNNNPAEDDQATVTVPSPQTGAIGNVVWLDENGNAAEDAGEAGISGLPVTLSGTDMFGNPVSQSTVTDAAGGYLFTDLVAGASR